MVPIDGMAMNQLFQDLADWTDIIKGASHAFNTANLPPQTPVKRKRGRPKMRDALKALHPKYEP